jgi:hypothetical protein
MERTTNSSRHDRHRSASCSSDDCQLRRGLTVELLLGGILIPGIIEYNARDDRVTFTIMSKNMPRSIRGKS